jgi:hypothetical protein
MVVEKRRVARGGKNIIFRRGGGINIVFRAKYRPLGASEKKNLNRSWIRIPIPNWIWIQGAKLNAGSEIHWEKLKRSFARKHSSEKSGATLV